MEPRLLLSAAKHHAKIPTHSKASPIGLTQLASPFVSGFSSPDPLDLTPAQVRGAYGVPSISFNGITGNGSGQTIAIVDAFDDPNAATDLDAFDAFYGLPNPPSFTKSNETGGTSLPGTDPAGAGNPNGTWEEEESLDIEWSHVMAPEANIILYEASGADLSDLVTTVETAEANSAVSVISMSWGGSQFNGEAADAEQVFFTNPNITYLASTGDSGAPAGFPATAPNVVAVGGTSLFVNGTSYSSESGWSGSGGGIDEFDAQPGYQTATVASISSSKRTTPDVSILADPNTGVAIYDSFDFGTTTPWVPGQEGGTSLASPLWAGLIADVLPDSTDAIAGTGDVLLMLTAQATFPAPTTQPTASNIYAVGRDGPAVKELATALYGMMSLSPDGKRVLFFKPSNQRSEQLAIMDADGSHMRMLMDLAVFTSGVPMTPTWHGSDRITFAATTGTKLPPTKDGGFWEVAYDVVDYSIPSAGPMRPVQTLSRDWPVEMKPKRTLEPQPGPATQPARG